MDIILEGGHRYVNGKCKEICGGHERNGGGLTAGIEARIDKSAPKEEQLAAFLAAAKDEGYEFTAEELREAVTAAGGEPAGELSDEELAAVAGGNSMFAGMSADECMEYCGELAVRLAAMEW